MPTTLLATEQYWPIQHHFKEQVNQKNYILGMENLDIISEF